MNEQLNLWRLSPVAQPNDPSWQGRRIWSELQIVAGAAGQALLLAARFDFEQAGIRTPDSQDQQQLRSGFEDERLYRLDRLDAPAPEGSSAGDIVSAQLLVPNA